MFMQPSIASSIRKSVPPPKAPSIPSCGRNSSEQANGIKALEVPKGTQGTCPGPLGPVLDPWDLGCCERNLPHKGHQRDMNQRQSAFGDQNPKGNIPVRQTWGHRSLEDKVGCFPGLPEKITWLKYVDQSRNHQPQWSAHLVQ